MPDVFTKTKRSQIMSRIRGRGNKETELALIRVLRAHRITGWRRHQAIFGKPDFVFREVRVSLFERHPPHFSTGVYSKSAKTKRCRFTSACR